MAYDPQNGYWYAAYNTANRDPSTTGGVLERASIGFELYRIPGRIPFNRGHPLATAHHSRYQPERLRTEFYPRVRARHVWQSDCRFGNTDGHVDINPPPPWNASPAAAGTSGGIANWKISSASWTPNGPLSALNRYVNQNDARGHDGMDRSQRRLYTGIHTGTSLPKSATGRDRSVLWL